MNTKDLYKDLIEIPRNGIYILKSEKERFVYITYSKDIVMSLGKNIKSIQDRVHTCTALNSGYGDLEFEVIETLSDQYTILDIHCRIHYYIDLYTELGYNIVTYKTIQKLKFKVDVNNDYKVVCKLVAISSRNEYIMGIFRDMEDAKGFIELYSNMKVLQPVYAINELSSNYFNAL